MKTEKKLTLAVSHKFQVDRAAGILRDLSLLKAGREAKGHGIYIDDRTLETALAVVGERGGLIKAYYTHDHVGSAAGYPGEYAAASEMRIPGYFSGIKVAGGQLVAETFALYDYFRKHHEEASDQILEMAEKTPQLLALSVEVWGYAVYVATDGTEYGERPEDVELLHDGMPTLRITELFAAAFVADGAATDGLFAAMSRRLFGAKTGEARAREVQAALQVFAQSPEGRRALVALDSISNDGPRPPNENPETHTMKTIETLKAKLGAGTPRFNEAMSIYGADPTQTAEAVEAQLSPETPPAAPAAPATTDAAEPGLAVIENLRAAYAEDRPAFAAAMSIFGEDPTRSAADIAALLASRQREEQIVSLNAKIADQANTIAALRTEIGGKDGTITRLTTERDRAKSQFELIRNSGYISAADAQVLGVDLGLPAAGEHGVENPWATGSINFTAQADIEKRDPELAKTLRAKAAEAAAAK